MMDAPLLTHHDLVDELTRIHAHRQTSRDAVLFGTGEAGEVDARIGDHPQRYRVIPVTCELALREALASDHDLPVAVLMDYGTTLPLDLQYRVAGAKVHVTDRAQRLIGRLTERRLGALEVRVEASAGLLRSAIGKAILAGAPVRPVAGTGTMVTEDAAWRGFVAASAGLPTDGTVSLDRLLEFVAAAPKPALFSELMAREPALRAEFETWLAGCAGEPGVQAWRAWESGRGRQVAAVAVVLESVADVYVDDEFIRGWLALPLTTAGVQVTGVEGVRQWGQAGAALLSRVGDKPLFHQLIETAETLVNSEDARRRLAGSRYLAFAFGLQLSSLASALRTGALEPSPIAVEQARVAYRALKAHWLADRDANADILARAESALRLIGWLATAMPPQPVSGPAYETALQLANDYAREGGFVDLARRRVRASGGTSDLEKALEAVLAAADARRDALDERFARSLVAWQRAGRPIAGVVPIERALDQLGAAFLGERTDRKQLVLLMDGLSWAVAVELLLDLQSQEISPIRWRPAQAKSVSPVAMLAALPTTTEVSRSTLFAGMRVTPGQGHPTSRDPDRFSAHATLSHYVPRAGGPRLLLRKDLEVSGGALSPAARELVASPDRVVACVVNAIDDDLDGTTQVRPRYRIDDLPIVRDLLRCAFDAGRSVLVVADHGHVPGARLQYRAATGICGGRWRTLAPGEQVQPYEVAIDAQSGWLPAGADRVALLYRETDRYGTSAKAGEHGGASLAEVVAPAFLLGDPELERRGMEAQPNDDDLGLMPLEFPAWWRMDGPLAVAPVRPAPVPIVSKPAQLQLGGIKPRELPEVVLPVALVRSQLADLLLNSEVFKAMSPNQQLTMREKVVPWLDVLVLAGGTMQRDRFAQDVGVLPARVPGAVAIMQECLGIDGYMPVTLDGASGAIVVQVDMLKQMLGG